MNSSELLHFGIQNSLAHREFENAIHLAECLVALEPTNEASLYLLADTLFQSGQFEACRQTLTSSGQSFMSKFLLSQSCFRLDLLAEAEAVLVSIVDGPGELGDLERASAYFLLGRVCKKQNRSSLAATHFERALGLNPLLVTARYELDSMGVSGNIGKHSISFDGVLEFVQKHSRGCTDAKSLPSPEEDSNIENAPNQPHGSTEIRQAGGLVTSRIPRHAPTRHQRESHLKNTTVRKDKKRTRSGETIPTSTVVPKIEISAPIITTTALDVRAEKLWSVLQSMQEACRLFHLFRLPECVRVLNELPTAFKETSWSLNLLARAHFEAAEYREAARCFDTLRQLYPHERDGLDFFSTTLWHLKDESALNGLCDEVFRENVDHPVAWCVAGNSFSLQLEHENALSCFEKAIKLSPKYAYAHNLCGHEFFSNEAFEKAQVCFENAVRLDSRMYYSWYGLGMVYFKQEKWGAALHHFKAALEVHCTSTVLHSFLGMVYQKINRHDEALLLYDKGIQLNAANPQVHYRKALCLSELQRHHEALREFQETIILASKESHVHIKVAGLYKTLGEPKQALKHLLIAMDLDKSNSSGSHINEIINSLNIEPDSDTAQEIFAAIQ